MAQQDKTELKRRLNEMLVRHSEARARTHEALAQAVKASNNLTAKIQAREDASKATADLFDAVTDINHAVQDLDVCQEALTTFVTDLADSAL